uniref:Malectin-like domain-containing protein n=1 Tax=Phaseolus vulgaris TaxID=3885 RepID=V7BGT5_PHAVU|nr:hypothetical protein PHAVU_007G129900g [Phaseolus vulgaris]ESW16108.1 hypothetical protein PHAVU_007G129900g [Phaseolus vulgaris]
MPLYINLRTNKTIPILTVVINGISYEATASTGFPYTLNLIFHSLNLLSTLSDNIALLSTLLLLLSPRYLPHQLWVFASPARYSFPIIDKGNNILRFHFHPLNFSNINLGQAHNFTRLASGFRNPRIVEYQVWVDADNLVVVFVSNKDSKLAFVNAIKVISIPKDLVPDTTQYLSQSKVEKFEGLNKQSLEVVYRVSVGGVKITPFNDSLWRTWIPDDEFFKTRVGSEKLYFGGRIKYRVGGASREVGPDNVYNSVRLIKSKNDFVPCVNMTWVFLIVGGYKYLVRLHFCDIASISLVLLSMYLDLSYITKSLASPFYTNFLVDGGDGVLSVSVCPSRSSMLHLIDGILNAVEVMKLKNSLSSLDGEVCADFVIKSWSKGNRYIVISYI